MGRCTAKEIGRELASRLPFLERGSGARGRQGPEDLQHQRQPSCRLMDESRPPGSWNLLVTRRVLAFHARMVPSVLLEYTLLVV